MPRHRYKKVKNKKKPFIISALIISILSTLLLTQGTFSKYVYEWYSEYVQADALKFYFGSNYLVSGQGNYPTYEYVIDDTANAKLYFEIYNYTDDLKVSEVDINDIKFDIGAYTLRYVQNVSDGGGTILYADTDGIYDETEPVWIQDQSDKNRYKAMVEIIVPEERFADGWIPTVKVIATASDPYKAEIAALFKLHTSANSDEMELSVKDTKDNNALLLTIKTMDTSGIATINWTEDGLYADKTNSMLTNIDNDNENNNFSFTTTDLKPYSTYEVILFKKDSTKVYSDASIFTFEDKATTGGTS